LQDSMLLEWKPQAVSQRPQITLPASPPINSTASIIQTSGESLIQRAGVVVVRVQQAFHQTAAISNGAHGMRQSYGLTIYS
jgi:hypothetical protein